mmetsp:Transcript_63079/g.118071  ORF Transcript_63079/g.118071 Transcript_63079/m.118071 type:complete len:211 (-) Transcript_63079:64-696(-)
MMVRFPSMTCFFSWCDNTPCMGLTLKSSAIFANASVTCVFLLPTCTSRSAASAAFQAAMMTSAGFPVTLSPPTTTVCAAAAMKPSIWHARSILATSPAFSCLDSPRRGLKCPTISFTEMHVGKAEPFSIFLPSLSFLLYSFAVSSSTILSPMSHSMTMSASGTQASTTFCSALFTMSPAARYFVVTSGLERSLTSSVSDSLSDIVQYGDG